MHAFNLSRRLTISASVIALLQFLPAQPTMGMQAHETPRAEAATAKVEPETTMRAANTSISAAAKSAPAPKNRRDRQAHAQKIEAEKITSFFVRPADSKHIQLSMLVAFKNDLAKSVRELVGEQVTPLVFSVSTMPNRRVYFDPGLLQLEQGGRVWQPKTDAGSHDILPLDENGKFGGLLTDSDVHQAVILLPAWMDAKAPITLRYGDFHYLAQFVAQD